MKGEKVLTLLSRGQLFQGHLESDTGTNHRVLDNMINHLHGGLGWPRYIAFGFLFSYLTSKPPLRAAPIECQWARKCQSPSPRAQNNQSSSHLTPRLTLVG